MKFNLLFARALSVELLFTLCIHEKKMCTLNSWRRAL